MTPKSASVCRVCRVRKVKCDGTTGGCNNCQRLGFKCSLTPSTGQGDYDGAQDSDGTVDVPRKRARLACQACKVTKTRCGGQQPTCEKCQTKGIECIYTPSKRNAGRESWRKRSGIISPALEPAIRRGERDSSGTAGGINGNLNIADNRTEKQDKSEVKRCIDTFFDVIYPSPYYSFIHRAVFLQMWQSSELDPVLLKAVCGVAARFVPGVPLDQQGSEWIDDAEADIVRSFDQPSIVRLQALQLIVLHRFSMRESRKMLFLSAWCSRTAFLLRLNYEDPTLPFLAQESRRRLMWSIYATDTFLAGGVPDFTLCRAEQMHIQLPCNESDFQFDQAVKTNELRQDASLSSTGNDSLLGFYYRVIDVRDRILRYTKNLSTNEGGTTTMQSDLAKYEEELAIIKSSLPDNMVFSNKNLFLRAYSKNSLPRFVLLHVWFHQSHCDLYRYLIPGFRETASARLLLQVSDHLIRYCQRRAIAHAQNLAEIFRQLVSLQDDVSLTDDMLAIPTYQCANILSRSVHMREAQLGLDVRAGVTACLEFASLLAKHSGKAAVVRDDIQKLLDHGAPSTSQSRQRTPEPPPPADMSPESVVSTGVQKHKFSRHSIVETANITDDSAYLSFRKTNSPLASVSAEQGQQTTTTGPRGVETLELGQDTNSQLHTSHVSELLPPQPQLHQHDLYDPITSDPSIANAFNWPWYPGLTTVDEQGLDFTFDPFVQIQTQWDIGNFDAS